MWKYASAGVMGGESSTRFDNVSSLSAADTFENCIECDEKWEV